MMRSGYTAALTGLFLAGLGSVALFEATAKPSKVAFTFITVDVPVPGAASTAIAGINNHGDIVGSYGFIPGAGGLGIPAGFLGKGFVWQANGKFTTIDGPGPNSSAASCNPFQGSFANCYYIEARGINEKGDVVGAYTQDVLNPDGGLFRAFVQQRGRPFNSYLLSPHHNTIFQKITDSGLIYGCFHDYGIDDSDQASMHGIINQLGHDGSIKNLEVNPEPSTMYVGGDPEAKRFAGVFYDFAALRHSAFIIEHGKRTNFDMPGSNVTSAWDMNNGGDVVGVFGDDPKRDPIVIDGIPFHGFLRDRHSNYIRIDYPGSIDTHVFAINDRGVIVGSYVDQQGKTHGFIARQGDDKAEWNRPVRLVNASFGGAQAATDADATVRVAMMPIVPNDTPLLPPAKAAPACHRAGRKSLPYWGR